MSSHFNYEIDERNLRGKLKNLSFPYNEEAWSSYEAFSEANKKTYKAPVLPAIKLNLNRNVILPVIFGAVIILFSMLLFNFISIKNKKPAENKAVKAPEQPAIQPKHEPQQLAQKPKPAVEKIIPSDTAKTMVQAPVKPQETVAAIPTPTVKQQQAQTIAVPTPTVQQQQAQTTDSPAWTVIEAGDIYIDPNIKSQVIGASKRNQTYKALEETIYFVKVSFDNNGTPAVGFIMKSRMFKNGSAMTAVPVQRKNRKPEVLESMQAPAVLPTGSAEKEPELK
jgi:hypothetical protein